MTRSTVYTHMDSPLGKLLIAMNDRGVVAIHFPQENPTRNPDWQHKNLQCAAAEQLRAYFDGTLKTFDLSLAPEGTPFQLKVWEELQKIPYGKTISYKTLAQRLGNPKAVRAVGAANGKNPLPIVIPCHRVIGSDGSLTGYAGGLSIKKSLLDFERQTAEVSLFERSLAKRALA